MESRRKCFKKRSGYFYLIALTLITLVCMSTEASALDGYELFYNNGENNPDLFGHAVAVGDFNGDGYEDLAVGIPRAEVSGKSNAGMVRVYHGEVYDGFFGSPYSSRFASTQNWHQDTPYIYGACESDDLFGSTLAAGDFNGDGYADLAIGVPGEDLGSVRDAGMVNIIYGSKDGLTGVGVQTWYQSKNGIIDRYESYDRFGYSLTTGDFDGDGFTDLAVGVPNEDLGSIRDAGMVNVIYGSKGGLTADGNQSWYQGKNGIIGKYESYDRFGDSLTTGDFDGDGFTDLAVGAPNEDLGSVRDAGMVNIIYGSKLDLTADGNQIWYQGKNSIRDKYESYDRFGDSLTTGDFDGDGFTDLAVGVPGEDIQILLNQPDAKDVGMVNVIYGSKYNLTADGNQTWRQTKLSEIGPNAYGSALTSGDFNSDGYMDLAVGVPGQDVDGVKDAGIVNILYGANNGLTIVDNEVVHQNTNYVEDQCEDGDFFGSVLSAGDFDNDGWADLVVGVPFEDSYYDVDKGEVNVLFFNQHNLPNKGFIP